MRRYSLSLALFMAGGILLGTRAFLSAADESDVIQKATPAKSEEHIKRLINQLGSERFADRERATQELLKLGKSALPSLKEATKSSDAEVRHRAQQLIERITAPDPKLVEKELAKLQGTWKVVSTVRDGVEATADEVKGMGLATFKGSKFYWGENEEGLGGTIVSIDPTKNPKTIEYDYGGAIYRGIYEIDGDTFKDCLTNESEKRPKEFTSKPGSGNQLMIHKRVK